MGTQDARDPALRSAQGEPDDKKKHREEGGLPPPFTVTVRFLGLPIREVMGITHGRAAMKYSMCSPKHVLS